MTQIDWDKAPEGATHSNRDGTAFHDFSNGGHRHWLISEWVYLARPFEAYDTPGELVARPWTGEGRPSLGSICILSGHTERLTVTHPEWAGREVKIYAHFVTDQGRELAAYVSEDHMIGGVGTAELFLPVRTPEQIAAEERDAALNQMVRSIKDHPNKYQGVSHLDQLKIQEDACIDLYDAGLRFEVKS